MDLSPTTMRTYRAQIEQTIRPRLGKVVLTRLTPEHLDDLYGQMKGRADRPRRSATTTPLSRRHSTKRSGGGGYGKTSLKRRSHRGCRSAA